ncbi:NAD-dependent epimerase/dehydratase family protein [Pseudonocardia sp. CA-107938]|uniref:NAD-dependent epimerase/dehydratase family protein n=1 Tax=Pseudonocardia sp. CA-107938 TaxID=3240021 RepID=UPI003D91D84E
MTVLVTGGAGYIGIGTCAQLVESGRRVRVLDSLLHGQRGLADELVASGVELQVGDVRDPAARAAALDGVDAVVHLAAIVGDPACARDPQHSHDVNVEGSRALIADAAAAGVARFVFASTCSNYGRMADPTVPITEDGELAPVSLYAEQKVGVEQLLLAGAHGMTATCLRFATIYGVAPRMRFDLTVNEFTRDLWAGRHLEVFGEQFWRPYVHVRDAGRAVRAVLDQPVGVVGGQVFNVGRTDENYRKLDIVEAVAKAVPDASVSYVARNEDPRDYKVSFEKIAEVLGFTTTSTVPDGIAEVIAGLEARRFGDPFAAVHRN